ncbi:MAG: phosphoribosylanthranilate isomerase [Chitinispirillia bacterium]|jgi:phosphoribosylanthranilate isomerase
MNPVVKICGITNFEDACMSITSGARYIGFIFAHSPRRVTPEKVASILRKLEDRNLRNRVTAVGVFVNENRGKIEKIISRTGIDIVQLHGDESPEEVNEYLFPWYKTIRIASKEDLDQIITPQNSFWECNQLLIDTKVEGIYGGTGKMVDLEIACRARDAVHKKKKKFFIAGGITPENVLNVLHTLNPDGIDIGSGVEYQKGKKSSEKLQELFSEIAGYTQL